MLVLLKEELMRWWVVSSVGQAQLKKRLILVGTDRDLVSLRRFLHRESKESIEVLAELGLNETPVERLVELLHHRSPNAVVLAAKHFYFGAVERLLAACELEGVEVWLMADFFKTQVSRTSLDDFHGMPMLVFRSTPDANWQMLFKQMLDLGGALLLVLLFSPVMAGADNPRPWTRSARHRSTAGWRGR